MTLHWLKDGVLNEKNEGFADTLEDLRRQLAELEALIALSQRLCE